MRASTTAGVVDNVDREFSRRLASQPEAMRCRCCEQTAFVFENSDEPRYLPRQAWDSQNETVKDAFFRSFVRSFAQAFAPTTSKKAVEGCILASWSEAMNLRAKKAHLFFEFPLCLSRACLGKIIIFSMKWREDVCFRTVRGHPAPADTRGRSWSSSPGGRCPCHSRAPPAVKTQHLLRSPFSLRCPEPVLANGSCFIQQQHGKMRDWLSRHTV